MPVRVGPLTAPIRHQYDKSDGGVWFPRRFEGGGPNSYADRQVCHERGYDLLQERNTLFVEACVFRSASVAPDQLCAQDHNKACAALDKTPAGKKARDLLFGLLDASQRLTAERYGYIDVWLYHQDRVKDDLGLRRRVRLNPAVFRFRRFYPNGNIKLGFPEEMRERLTDRHFAFTACLHPIQPFPNDDIVATQIMTLLTDPNEFVRSANWTDRITGNPLRFTGMYAEPPKPKPLVLPFKRHGKHE